jgi:hypothetical protein
MKSWGFRKQVCSTLIFSSVGEAPSEKIDPKTFK